MAGIEGERPQNKDAGHPPRAFMGGERYERSEVHSGGTPLVETRLRNGKLQDISHLYTKLGEDGRLRWWTERQSIANFVAEVRAGKERGDPRYENIPEDQVPSSITHTTEIIYSRGEKPRESGKHWVHLSYITSRDYPEQQSVISILDTPVADTGNGAEPKQERDRKGEEQDVFTAGREKSGFQEDTQQRRSEAHSYGDASKAGAKDASSQEQGELAEARVVLQTIVNTHEDTIDETTPLDRIAGLTTEQVRVAERRVAQKIISDARVKRINYGVVIKETPQGRLGLVHGGQLGTSEEVALHLNEGGSLVMINTYALNQPPEGQEQYYGFEDFRPGGKRANLGHLALRREQGRQLDDIRLMWQGLRWMSANMLEWDNPKTIMPEELDSQPLRNNTKPPKPPQW